MSQMRIPRLRAGQGLLKVTPGFLAWLVCTGLHGTLVTLVWQAHAEAKGPPPGPTEGVWSSQRPLAYLPSSATSLLYDLGPQFLHL